MKNKNCCVKLLLQECHLSVLICHLVKQLSESCSNVHCTVGNFVNWLHMSKQVNSQEQLFDFFISYSRIAPPSDCYNKH